MGNSARIDRNRELEKISRSLEPDAAQRSTLLNAAVDYSESYLGGLSSARAFRHTEDYGSDLYNLQISDQSHPIEDLLAILAENVDSICVNTPSKGHLGYIPGGPIYPSALGDAGEPEEKTPYSDRQGLG